jgi:hypothetical protein
MFLLVFVFSVLLAQHQVYCSINSNYHIYNYDQTSQQFTPDGRLIQVEYASNAVEHSSPVVVVECNNIVSTTNTNNDDAKTTTKTATTRSSSLSSVYPCMIVLTIPHKHQIQHNSPQHRIVILNNNNNNKEQQEYNDDHDDGTAVTTTIKSSPYVVIMSGILADSLALLQAALMDESKHQLDYHSCFTIQQMAIAMAQACHARTQRGGLRPYGSTMVLCGYNGQDDVDNVEEYHKDDDDNKNQNNDGGGDGDGDGYRSLIFQTDPSGAILQHHTNPRHDIKETKPDHDTRISCYSHVRCIVGGSPTEQRQIEKKLEQSLQKLDRQYPPPTLAERIAFISKILYQETAVINNKKDMTTTLTTTTTTTTKSSMEEIPLPSEVVVISPRLGGCHRLDDQQMNGIRKLLLRDGNMEK